MCDIRVLISILYTTTKLQISLKIVCKIYCMVSDNDCDVAVCDIKGRGDFSHQAILCVLRIYKIYACISYLHSQISLCEMYQIPPKELDTITILQLSDVLFTIYLYLLKLEKSISYMTCVWITRQQVKTTRQQVKTTRQRVKATRQRLKTTRQRIILTFLSIVELN